MSLEIILSYEATLFVTKYLFKGVHLSENYITSIYRLLGWAQTFALTSRSESARAVSEDDFCA